MSPLNRLKSTAADFYLKHKRWLPTAAFVFGFIVDMVMLTRIDDLLTVIQQAIYLSLASYLVAIELIEKSRVVQVPRFLEKIWPYRESILQFLLGALLNGYTIFYFKSASALTSMLFIAFLVVVLVVNEFRRFGQAQTKVHVAYLSLCLTSYFIALVPMVLGFINTLTFMFAVGLSVGVFFKFYYVLRNDVRATPSVFKTYLLQPYFAVQILFVVCYFANLIPPVPLSIKYMGIFHEAKKSDRGYELKYNRPQWKFWQHGDQTFYAQPGDSIYCYVQIFSPTRFKDQLQVRWLYRDEKQGWLSSDAIPLTVVGGREDGFRALTLKNNYQPGAWRVQVETMNRQEIGRIEFDVIDDATSAPRPLRTIFK